MTDNSDREIRELVPVGDLAPSFIITGDDIRHRIAELQDFVKQYMVEGEDYGVIPGTAKPTLLKPGAEKLCDVYGFQRLFQTMNRVEDWEHGLFHYEVRADLVNARSGLVVAQGFGSANSKEARYRWRQANRSCPECDAEAIIKGKAEYGGGWLCFKKQGGCGAKFVGGDARITDQPVGRIENDDPFTLVNTLLKMAKKRALVDAVLSATRSSGLFTQDMEDIAPEPAPQPAASKPKPDKWRCSGCKATNEDPERCYNCGRVRGAGTAAAAAPEPEPEAEPEEAVQAALLE